MAGTNQQLARQGGRVNVSTGQLVAKDDINRVGSMAMQSLVHWLLLAFYDDHNEVPLSGFPRARLGSDHCLGTPTGDLTYSVAPGFGMFFDSAATDDEYGIGKYQPIVVDTAVTGTLDAHDATNPRIDIICLSPNLLGDQAASRSIKDPNTAAISSSSVNQRARFSHTLTVVTGTPGATPVEPSTPAGSIKIGVATVPATSGAAVWQDTRPLLEFGHLFKGISIPEFYHKSFVPEGGASELEVAASSPAAMTVEVTRGRAVIGGMGRIYFAETLTITTADGSNPRIDVVVANRDGTLSVVAGTPAASPAVPSLTSTQLALAQIAVGTGVTTIVSGNITDKRIREPFGGDQIAVGTMNWNRLDHQAVHVDIGTPSGESTEVASMALTLYQPDRATAYTDSAGLGEVDVVARVYKHAGGPVSGSGYGLGGITTDIPTLVTMSADDVVISVNPTSVANAVNTRGHSASGELFFSVGSGTILELRRLSTSDAVGVDFYIVLEVLSRPGSAKAHQTVTFS